MKNAMQTTMSRSISAWQHPTAHDNRVGKAEIRNFAGCLVDAASCLAIIALGEYVLGLLGISPLYMPRLVVTVYAVKVPDRKFLSLEYETCMLRG